jgi:hypothetical protein
VNDRVLRVALFWSRTNLARRRASYLGIVLLLAVLGGVAMASVSGARGVPIRPTTRFLRALIHPI